MTILLDSEIKYDRVTKDYAIYIGGELIGYGRNYSEAEQLRTAELIARYEIANTPEKIAEIVMSEVK